MSTIASVGRGYVTAPDTPASNGLILRNQWAFTSIAGKPRAASSGLYPFAVAHHAGQYRELTPTIYALGCPSRRAAPSINTDPLTCWAASNIEAACVRERANRMCERVWPTTRAGRGLLLA